MKEKQWSVHHQGKVWTFETYLGAQFFTKTLCPCCTTIVRDF